MDRVVYPDAARGGRVTADVAKPVVVDVKTVVRPVPVMPAPKVRHDDDADAEADAAHDPHGADNGIAEVGTRHVHPRPVHRSRVVHRYVDNLRIGRDDADRLVLCQHHLLRGGDKGPGRLRSLTQPLDRVHDSHFIG
jgi:hypothetical protein